MTQLQFEVAFFSDDSQIGSQAIPGIYTGLGGTQVDVAPQFLPHPSWSHVCSSSVNSVLWGQEIHQVWEGQNYRFSAYHLARRGTNHISTSGSTYYHVKNFSLWHNYIPLYFSDQDLYTLIYPIFFSEFKSQLHHLQVIWSWAMPQFFHLHSGNNNSIHFVWLSWG